MIFYCFLANIHFIAKNDPQRMPQVTVIYKYTKTREVASSRVPALSERIYNHVLFCIYAEVAFDNSLILCTQLRPALLVLALLECDIDEHIVKDCSQILADTA